MQFVMRMLHRQMQRQVRLPEDERPRVPLIVDEAHYVAGTENFVDQVATHRRAGLEVACGLQYFAQLGSGSEHQEKIRKGILNLLQSRLLFRIGDARRRRGSHPDRDGRLLDDDPRRPRLARAPARHPRTGAELPQPLLPGLLDRRGTRIRQLHRPDLPLPDLRRRVGAPAPRRSRPSASGPTPTRLDPRTPHAPTRREYLAVLGQAPQALGALGRRPRRVIPAGATRPVAAGDEPAAQPAPARRRPAHRPHQRRSARARRDAADQPPPNRPPTTRAGAPTRPRPSERCASTTSPRPRRRSSTPAPSAASSASPPRRTPTADRSPRHPRACASSRSWTASTRSAPPNSSTAPPASRASTTRTTRSSRCSTAPASRPRA